MTPAYRDASETRVLVQARRKMSVAIESVSGNLKPMEEVRGPLLRRPEIDLFL
jgi:hypothetical protein